MMHDWTLRNIDYQWAQRRATVVFVAPDSSVREIVLDEVESMNIPHVQPWREGVSVNDVKTRSLDNGLEELLIRMQSGDETMIIGKFTSLPEENRQ